MLSFPGATKMFQFAPFARSELCIHSGVYGYAHTSCLIQRSPDQSLFGGSPRLIAAFNVFLRWPMPRHPPSALSSLVTILEELFRLNEESNLIDSYKFDNLSIHHILLYSIFIKRAHQRLCALRLQAISRPCLHSERLVLPANRDNGKSFFLPHVYLPLGGWWR